MKRRLVPILVVAAMALWAAAHWPAPRPARVVTDVAALPRTFPELDGVTLPPNIAPPGVRVKEPGTAFSAIARGDRGPAVEVSSRRAGIVFPERPWHRLLAANTGGAITITVTVRDGTGTWTRFAALHLDVAAEPIDRYLVYRNLTPLYNEEADLGVYQRDLTGFRSRCVLHGRQFSIGCVNCHTFCQGSGGRFTLAVRSKQWGSGTLLVADGQVKRLKQAVGYAAWHPNGQLVMFTATLPRQFFHTAGEQTREPLDIRAQLVCYDVRQQRFTAVPALSSRQFLNSYPCWSPDGRWLYFSRARRLWDDATPFPPPRWPQVRYSLMRIAYDPDSGAWGQPEMVRSGEAADRSFIYPRLSPDGRWLLYTSLAYGNFAVIHADSLLALIDLQTDRDVPVDINSDQSQSWHSWSRNGRWIVFCSKRADGLFAKLYLSYFDESGHFHAPLLLPQRDPGFYDTFWYSYNVPELIDTPIRVDAGRLGRAIRGPNQIDAPLPPEVAPPSAAAWPAR
jgi:hypothetical protein